MAKKGENIEGGNQKSEDGRASFSFLSSELGALVGRTVRQDLPRESIRTANTEIKKS